MSINDTNSFETNLSLTEQIELGRRTANGDKAAREKLVLSCVSLVKSFYKTPLCHYFSCCDDVFQDGMLGVVEAVDLYDYKRNTMFTTFAYAHIYKRIVNGIVSRAPLKISEKDFFNTILVRSTVDSFYAAYRVSPTSQQVSQLTNIPVRDVELLLKRSIISPSILATNSDQDELYLPKEDASLSVEKTLKKLLQEKIVEEALETLSADEKEIVQSRYLYKERKVSLRELAELQNISIVAVSKREKVAIKKLFAFFVSRNISFDDVV